MVNILILIKYIRNKHYNQGKIIKSLLFFRISNHNRLLVITEKLLAKYIRLFLTDSQKYGSVLKNSIDEYPANSVY